MLYSEKYLEGKKLCTGEGEYKMVKKRLKLWKEMIRKRFTGRWLLSKDI